jgi:hypothetical protein
VSSQDKEPFLSRWSRRKLESPKEEAPPPAAPVAAPREGATSAPAKPALPPVDSLQGLASEYKDFLRPGVDEKLRTAALRKLFRDPHFSVMDGLDVYIDDYSKPDPIPEAMLRTLQHAKGMLFGDGSKEPSAPAEKSGEVSADAAGESAPAHPDAKADVPASPPAPEDKT